MFVYIRAPIGKIFVNIVVKKLVQGFRVTCLFTCQYNTKGYDTITDVIFW